MTKSYLKKNDSTTIEVFGEKIKIKKTGFAETRKALGIATKVVGNKTEVDASLVGVLRVIYAIESWDLVDENGKPLPIDIKTFDEVLDEEFVGEIMQEVQKFQGGAGLETEEKN